MSKIAKIIIIFLAVTIAKNSYADFSGDQFLLPQCRVRPYDNTIGNSGGPSPDPGNPSNSDAKYGIYQSCPRSNGNYYNNLYLPLSSQSIGTIQVLTNRAWMTGAKYGNQGMGTMWVQNAGVNESGNYAVDVCFSINQGFVFNEGCQTYQDGYTGSAPTGSSVGAGGDMTVSTVMFDITSDGSGDTVNAKDANGDEVAFNTGKHKGGYVQILYNNDCPYDQTKRSDYDSSMTTPTDGLDYDSCKYTNVILPISTSTSGACYLGSDGSNAPYDASNNCRLLADSLFAPCPDRDSICPCVDSSDNNICDDKYMPKPQKGISSPTGSVYACFVCNAAGRKVVDVCSSNVGDSADLCKAYNKMDNNIKQNISKYYGQGKYICVYLSGSSNERIGCMKVPNLAPPRPFPRIARAFQGSNLDPISNPGGVMFQIVPFVDKFRDEDLPGTRCQTFNAEYGDSARGTFYRPKIRIKYGDAVSTYTFTTLDYGQATMPTYGSTSIVSTGWNEATPAVVEAQTQDQTTCQMIQQGLYIYVCTRMEYDPSSRIESYVAYYTETAPGRESCDSLASSGLLMRIGSVPRPPLKYTSVIKGGIPVPVMPVSLSIKSLTDTSQRYPITVTVDPSVFPLSSDMIGYHNGLDAKSVAITPTHINPNGGSNPVVSGTDCAFLYLHPFCVQEDPCIGLDYMTSTARTRKDFPADISNCSVGDFDCFIYLSTKDICQARTYCPQDYTSIVDCQAGEYYASLLPMNNYGLSTYKINQQWTPSVCLISGVDYPASENNKLLYGDYGDKTMEYSVAFANNGGSISPRLLRVHDADDDRINTSILPLPSIYFAKKDIGTVIAMLRNTPYMGGPDMIQNYFGANCDNGCVASKIQIRPRVAHEMNLCLNFIPSSSSTDGATHDWIVPWQEDRPENPVDSSVTSALGGNWLQHSFPGSSDQNLGIDIQEMHIPLQCNNLAYAIQGPGGGATKLMTSSLGDKGAKTGAGPSGGIAAGVMSIGDSGTVEALYIVRSIGSETPDLVTGYSGNYCGHWVANGINTKATTMYVSNNYNNTQLFIPHTIYSANQGDKELIATGVGSFSNNYYWNNSTWCGPSASTGVSYDSYNNDIKMSHPATFTTFGLTKNNSYQNGSLRNASGFSLVDRAGNDGSAQPSDDSCHSANNMFNDDNFFCHCPLTAFDASSSSDKKSRYVITMVDYNTKNNATNSATNTEGDGSSATTLYDAINNYGISKKQAIQANVVDWTKQQAWLNNYLANPCKWWSFILEGPLKNHWTEDDVYDILSSHSQRDYSPLVDSWCGGSNTSHCDIKDDGYPCGTFSYSNIPWPIFYRTNGAHGACYDGGGNYDTCPECSDDMWSGGGTFPNKIFGAGGSEFFLHYNYDSANLRQKPSATMQKGGWGAGFVWAYDTHGNFTGACNTTCPRAAIDIGSGDAVVTCEYGGIALNQLGSMFQTFSWASEIPYGMYAMPTHCVDSEGNIILPSSDFGIQSCPSGKVVYTGNNRYYGVCVNSNSLTSAQSAVLQSQVVISGSGVWCDPTLVTTNGTDPCPAIRYTAAYADGFQIVRNLLNRVTYEVSCNAAGMYSYPVGSANMKKIPNVNYPKTSNKYDTIKNLVNRRYDDTSGTGTSTGLGDALVGTITGGPTFMCPRLNPNKVPYDPLYSYNADWPKATGDTIAIANGCIAGYIPYDGTTTLKRYCSYYGTWRGMAVNSDKPCLYTCPPITDEKNHIMWNSPSGYANAVSLPVCINDSLPLYKNCKITEELVTTNFPNGYTANSFARKCNMPSAIDPVQYAYVNADTTDGKQSYWAPEPAGARCMSTTYFGEVVDNLHLCYDGGLKGNEVVGVCQAGYIYQVNGVLTTAPPRMAQENYATDIIGANAYVYAKNISAMCTMVNPNASYQGCTGCTGCGSSGTGYTGQNQTTSCSGCAACNAGTECSTCSSCMTINGSSICSVCNTCNKKTIANVPSTTANTTLPFSPTTATTTNNNFYCQTLDYGANSYPVQSVAAFIPIVENLTWTGTDYLSTIEPKLETAVETAIITDNALSASSCYLGDESPNADKIKNAMAAYGSCSFLCYDVDTNTINFHTCTDDLIALGVDPSSCVNVCSQTTTTAYYNNSGITTTYQSYSQATGSGANTSSCVGTGIGPALMAIRNNDATITQRVGSYCDVVKFSASVKTTEGYFKVPNKNVAFGGKYNSNNKSCWKPADCTVPAIGWTVPHATFKWLVLADISTSTDVKNRFSYSSSVAQSTTCFAGQNKYNLVSSNAYIVQVSCFDGTLYLTHMSAPYGNNKVTPDCLLDVPTIDTHISYLLANNATQITTTDGVGSSIISSMPTDKLSSYNYYASLPTLRTTPFVAADGFVTAKNKQRESAKTYWAGLGLSMNIDGAVKFNSKNIDAGIFAQINSIEAERHRGLGVINRFNLWLNRLGLLLKNIESKLIELVSKNAYNYDITALNNKNRHSLFAQKEKVAKQKQQIKREKEQERVNETKKQQQCGLDCEEEKRKNAKKTQEEQNEDAKINKLTPEEKQAYLAKKRKKKKKKEEKNKEAMRQLHDINPEKFGDGMASPEGFAKLQHGWHANHTVKISKQGTGLIAVASNEAGSVMRHNDVTKKYILNHITDIKEFKKFIKASNKYHKLMANSDIFYLVTEDGQNTFGLTSSYGNGIVHYGNALWTRLPVGHEFKFLTNGYITITEWMPIDYGYDAHKNEDVSNVQGMNAFPLDKIIVAVGRVNFKGLGAVFGFEGSKELLQDELQQKRAKWDLICDEKEYKCYLKSAITGKFISYSDVRNSVRVEATHISAAMPFVISVSPPQRINGEIDVISHTHRSRLSLDNRTSQGERLPDQPKKLHAQWIKKEDQESLPFEVIVRKAMERPETVIVNAPVETA